jgi:flagellar basal-body rod modification protein FlgD
MNTSAIQTNPGSSAPSAAGSPTVPSTSVANQSVFMQLLIAQLKHQDPENPADGTQFVTQLAQFTTLEQTTQSRVDLDQILKALQTAASAKSAVPPTQSA